ncbi:hypothetical protein [Acinetobacter sp. TR11]|uniref:hypothetical protein n=1 Tax=Acinetobacter sp. TR11 TaxID=3003393 RepID=UPI0022AC8F74|nr:hypothetical protein [Acinetobacter sp. TR11]WAU72628.1 hypothetical protein O1450_11020 [Acinetobacter sp. TR11]
MNKIILLVLTFFATSSYAQSPIGFCKKIEGHAHTMMYFRNGNDTPRNKIESQLSQSAARPYLSTETKKWFNITLNEAYKSKWSSKNYKIPTNAAYNPNARPQDYAAQYFKEEIYNKCISEASPDSRYCSDEANEARTNPQIPKSYRARLNGLCLS